MIAIATIVAIAITAVITSTSGRWRTAERATTSNSADGAFGALLAPEASPDLEHA